MKLKQLMDIQKSGALKVSSECTINNIVIGGVRVTLEQCRSMAQSLGWVEFDMPPWEIISKTNKFVNGLRANLKNEEIIENTEVVFQNRRRMETDKYFDRIKLVSPYFDLTVLYGMPGLKGLYSVYDGSNGNRNPAYGFRSLKQLALYMNGLV